MRVSDIFDADFWQRIFGTTIFAVKFWLAVLDILVVWFLVYQLIRTVRGTRAVQLIKGVALFFTVRLLSGFLQLTTINWLMDQFINYGAIAVVIIFQPEIRKMLEVLGRTSLMNSNREKSGEVIIQSYEKAISYMAKRRIGALISIERKDNLQDYIDTGISLDAQITSELLINIFIPNTPLHDGAVIIREHKIEVASAYLPLSENTNIPKEYGTRHRAAIGLSEVTDALTIIVSEETGDISVTLNNKFISDLKLEEMTALLSKYLVKDDVEDKHHKSSFLSSLWIKTNKEKKDGEN